ncbi:MAG TPA: DUF456 domain-containing protein [Nocardioidaceae bacterium]
MSALEIAVGLVILVGLVGIVVPILPGTMLVLGAVLVWTVAEESSTAWVVFALATTLLVLGQVVKYAVPHRGLRSSGVPGSALVLGGVLGIIGFFVIPVIGLVLGFVLGVYLAELRRVGHEQAWPSTVAAVKAVGVSILVELAAALLATGVWIVGVLSL